MNEDKDFFSKYETSKKQKILLFGDSITAYIPKEKLDIDWFYNLNKNVENGNDNYRFYKCGTENYPIEWLRDYIFPRIDVELYDVIVLQCGINDFFMPYQDEDYAKKSPDEIVQSIIDFLNLIQQKTGKEVALQSLYPVKNGNITPRESIKYINAKLENYCEQNKIKFLDMYSLLVGKDGDYADGLSDDGLHPNAKGYKIVVNKLLETFLSKNKTAYEALCYEIVEKV